MARIGAALLCRLSLLGLLAAAGPAPAQDDDPFLWLETLRSERAMAWVQQQNAATLRAVAVQPAHDALVQRLTAIATSADRLPAIVQMGERVYNFWQDARHPRGLWRRTTLDGYRLADPPWETVLDLDALAAAEQEAWAWKGADCLWPAYTRCLVALSRGGSDATRLREFDLGRKAFVDGGFDLPESKGGAEWLDADTLWVARDFGPGTLTRSGYPRQLRRLERGRSLAQAPVVFEGSETDVGVGADVVHEAGARFDLVRRATGSREGEWWLWRGTRLQRLELPRTVDLQVASGLLLMRLREDWTVGAHTHPAGALLAAPVQDFFAPGGPPLERVFTPAPGRTLQRVTPLRSAVLLSVLDQVQSRLLEARRDSEGRWTIRPVPVPAFERLSVSALDRRAGNRYLLSTAGFTRPPTLELGDIGGDARETLKAMPPLFDAGGLEVTQHLATSKDGTRVPYFQVMRRGAPLDGSHPTLLNGYGGFEVAQLPGYSATMGAAWLERGGVWVLANLRGGGELGPAWHRTALRAGRQKAHDDFAAVAEDLVRRKVTSPPRLGILGGSQGGLLVGATLLQRPDLFGAAVATVPLMDMKRYHRLPPGASWMSEYGDPDQPEDWAFIGRYSPYQNVKKGVAYPPLLITTSTHDDRVHPGHGRKMAARMQELGHPASYFEYTEGGHGAGTTPQQSAATWALIYGFLARTLIDAPAAPSSAPAPVPNDRNERATRSPG